MLYVKRDKIAKIWPLFAAEEKNKADIRKFEEVGTHSAAPRLAIGEAMLFHNGVGGKRKEARLRHLQRHWTTQVRSVPNIVLNTPGDAKRSCAIANVGIAGLRPADLAKTLLDRYKVWTVAIDNAAAGVHGVRVTPQLFTTPAELDVLVKALKELSSRGA